MVIIIKVLHFIGNIGKCLSMIVLLFLLSIICVSIKLSKENIANPFCFNKYKDEIIVLNYDEIIEYEYKFECSTLYINMKVNDDLTKKEILTLLVSIGNNLKQYEDYFTHFEIKSTSLEKTIYASINLKNMEISYV